MLTDLSSFNTHGYFSVSLIVFKGSFQKEIINSQRNSIVACRIETLFAIGG